MMEKFISFLREFVIIRIITVIAFFFITGIASAATIYVATDGSDVTGDGSSNNPYATPQAGLNNAYAGDTVYVEAGFYRGNINFPRSGSSGQPITLEGEEGAVLDGSVLISGWEPATEVGSGVFKKPVSEMPFLPCHMTWNDKYVLRLSCDYMTQQEVFDQLAAASNDSSWDGLEAVFSPAVLNSVDAEYLYIRFRNGQDPDNEDVTFGKRWLATDTGVINIVGKSYITVKGFTIQGGGVGVMIRNTGADDNIIEDNVIKHGKYSVFIHGQYGGGNRNHIRNNEITLNYIYDLNPRSDLHGYIWECFKYKSDFDREAVALYYAGNDNQVYGNHIYQHWGGIQDWAGDDTATPYADYCKRLKVYDNVICDIADDGLEPTGGEIDAEWYDNFVYECNINIRIKDPRTGPLYIYRNQTYTPQGPTHTSLAGCDSADVYFASGTDATVYVYHNSFGSYLGLLMGNKSENGAPNTWFVNNIFSNKIFWEHDEISETWLTDMDAHFGYNWCGGDAAYYSWMDSNYSNIIASGKRLWDFEDPDFTFNLGSILGNGIDLSSTWQLDGEQKSALPGMTAGYFSGSAPDLGAIQFVDISGSWTLNDGSGSTAADSSVNGNDGTIYGASWVNGIIGSALNFDGINDYIDCGTDDSLNFGASTDFSFGMWFKTSATSIKYLLSKAPDGGAGYYMYLTSAGKLNTKISDGTNSVYYVSNSVVNDGQWHHVAATFDRDGKLTIYIDGSKDGSVSISSVGDIDNTTELFIGSFDDRLYFNGSIDEVKIFGRVLNDKDVSKLYSGSTEALSCSMDEGNGLLINDETDNNNNGTVNGASWVTGAIGSALDFDGVNDYVDCGTDASLNFGASTDFSFGMWFKTSATSIKYLLSKAPDGGAGYYMYLTSAGKLNTKISDGTNSVYYVSNSVVNDGQWHHVAATFDRDGKLTVYIDGSEDGSVSISSVGDIDNTTELCIGSFDDRLYFDGSIDEVKVYRRVLDPNEVNKEYYTIDKALSWSVDEGAGQFVYDETGNSNDGIVYGASWTTGVIGSALDFDGIDNNVDCGNDDTLNFGSATDFSLEMWFKTSATSIQYLLSKSPDGGPGYYIYLTSTGKLSTKISDGTNSAYYINSSAINDGQWHHIAATFDRDGNLTVYIDGLLDGTVSISSVGNIDNSSIFSIGSMNERLCFDGAIDEVKVYRRALSSSEVNTHYAATQNGLSCSLDENTGYIVYDATGNENNGVIHGASWTTGYSGSALDFDGVDDYVDCGNDVSLNFGTDKDFSIDMWFKTSSSSIQYLLSKSPDGGAGYYMYMTSTGKLNTKVSDGTNSVYYVSNAVVNDGNWHHVIATFDRNGNLTVYIDGAKDGYVSMSSIGNVDNDVELRIGSFDDRLYFDGVIDEVKVYRKVSFILRCGT